MKQDNIIIPYEGNENIYAGFIKIAKEIVDKKEVERIGIYAESNVEISA